MRRVLNASVFAVIALMNAGCAWTTAVRVDPHAPDIDGFVYYECKPLVVVSGSSVNVQYVKNPNKAYAVRFGTFLAKNDVKLTFDRECGVTQINSNLDTTSIIPLLQDVLDKAVPDLKPVLGAANGTYLQVYDVVFDDLGNIVELKPLIRSKNLITVPKADG